MEHIRAEDELAVHVEERLQSGTALSRPRRQRRTRRVHFRARVDVFLPVVRQMVHEATHQDVRDQPRGRHALVDDLRRNRLLHQGLAALAGPFAADVAVYEELGRHDVELLGDVLADAYHRLAAIRRWAGGVLGLVPVLDASQVLGQHLAPRLALGLLVGRRRRCLAALALQGQQLRLAAGLIFGESVLEHLALLGVHALGLGAEPPGLLAAQLERDPFDFHVLELDRLRLTCDLFVALVELLALLADELALLADASQHLRGNFGQ